MVLGESNFSNIQTLEFKFSDGNNDIDGLDKENILLKNDDRHMKILSEQDGIALVVDSPNTRLRVALGVLFRLVLPLVHGVAKGWNGIRGYRVLQLLRRIGESRGTLTTLLAFAANTVSMSLSSVQVVHKIDPLLRIIKLRKSIDASSKLQLTSNIPKTTNQPDKCVNCVVLYEPPQGVPITADIILIHGLHGSLVNTWKQGQWNSEGRLVNFERPPKPPVRPPKRQRHSRPSLIIPPHQSKKAKLDDVKMETKIDRVNCSAAYKYADKPVTYELGDSVQKLDEMEYSFPTFRLRLENHENKAQILKRNHQANSHKTDYWSPCWPRDWLPLDCPGVRVISINYTTDPYLWRPVWITKRHRTSLVERAREMSDLLIEKGVGQNRPIVWVGHSKGGIFIKQIIVDAWESGRQAVASLWRSSRGAFFYSVPHLGSPLADFSLPLLRQSIELSEIQKNSPGIMELHRRFVALYQGGHLKIDMFSFVETAMTLMSVLYLRIVGTDSADPGIGEVCGVHLDHREICKPRSRNCILYTELVKMIKKITN